MKAADEDGFSENVLVNADENFGSRGTLVERQRRIQREELERIMMERSWCGRAWAEVAEFAIMVSCLDRSISKLGSGGNTFRE